MSTRWKGKPRVITSSNHTWFISATWLPNLQWDWRASVSGSFAALQMSNLSTLGNIKRHSEKGNLLRVVQTWRCLPLWALLWGDNINSWHRFPQCWSTSQMWALLWLKLRSCYWSCVSPIVLVLFIPVWIGLKHNHVPAARCVCCDSAFMHWMHHDKIKGTRTE
jgi:hypothetical protein